MPEEKLQYQQGWSLEETILGESAAGRQLREFEQKASGGDPFEIVGRESRYMGDRLRSLGSLEVLPEAGNVLNRVSRRLSMPVESPHLRELAEFEPTAGWISRPTLETYYRFLGDETVRLTAFQVQEYNVVRQLLDPNRQDIRVMTQRLTFHEPEGQKEEDRVTASILVGNELTWRATSPNRVRAVKHPYAFHPKLGATGKLDEKGKAYIATQNLTPPLGRNNTFESILILDIDPSASAKKASESDLGQEIRWFLDWLIPESLKDEWRLSSQILSDAPRAAFARLAKATSEKRRGLFINEEILPMLSRLLNEFGRQRGDRMVISMGEISLLNQELTREGKPGAEPNEAWKIKEKILKGLRQGRIELITDRRRLDHSIDITLQRKALEAIPNRTKEQQRKLEKLQQEPGVSDAVLQAVAAGQVRPGLFGYHHDKSIAVFNDGGLRVLVTGSANLTSMSLLPLADQPEEERRRVLSHLGFSPQEIDQVIHLSLAQVRQELRQPGLPRERREILDALRVPNSTESVVALADPAYAKIGRQRKPLADSSAHLARLDAKGEVRRHFDSAAGRMRPVYTDKSDITNETADKFVKKEILPLITTLEHLSARTKGVFKVSPFYHIKDKETNIVGFEMSLDTESEDKDRASLAVDVALQEIEPFVKRLEELSESRGDILHITTYPVVKDEKYILSHVKVYVRQIEDRNLSSTAGSGREKLVYLDTNRIEAKVTKQTSQRVIEPLIEKLRYLSERTQGIVEISPHYNVDKGTIVPSGVSVHINPAGVGSRINLELSATIDGNVIVSNKNKIIVGSVVINNDRKRLTMATDKNTLTLGPGQSQILNAVDTAVAAVAAVARRVREEQTREEPARWLLSKLNTEEGRRQLLIGLESMLAESVVRSDTRGFLRGATSIQDVTDRLKSLQPEDRKRLLSYARTLLSKGLDTGVVLNEKQLEERRDLFTEFYNERKSKFVTKEIFEALGGSQRQGTLSDVVLRLYLEEALSSPSAAISVRQATQAAVDSILDAFLPTPQLGYSGMQGQYRVPVMEIQRYRAGFNQGEDALYKAGWMAPARFSHATPLQGAFVRLMGASAHEAPKSLTPAGTHRFIKVPDEHLTQGAASVYLEQVFQSVVSLSTLEPEDEGLSQLGVASEGTRLFRSSFAASRTDQLSARLKNLLGGRPLADITPEALAYALSLGTRKKPAAVMSGRIMALLPRLQAELVKRGIELIQRENPRWSAEEVRLEVTRRLQQRQTDPESTLGGVIGGSKPRRFAVTLGGNLLGDYNLGNADYFQPVGQKTPLRVTFSTRGVRESLETIEKISRFLAQDTFFLPAQRSFKLKGEVETFAAGVYQLVDGKPRRIASFDEEGRVAVAESIRPWGDIEALEKITMKVTAFSKRHHQSAVGWIPGDRVYVSRDGTKVTLETEVWTFYETDSTHRQGFGPFKNLMSLTQGSFFEALEQTLPGRFRTLDGEREKLYALVSPSTMKGHVFQTGAEILVRPELRAQVHTQIQQDTRGAAAALAFSFLNAELRPKLVAYLQESPDPRVADIAAAVARSKTKGLPARESVLTAPGLMTLGGRLKGTYEEIASQFVQVLGEALENRQEALDLLRSGLLDTLQKGVQKVEAAGNIVVQGDTTSYGAAAMVELLELGSQMAQGPASKYRSQPRDLSSWDHYLKDPDHSHIVRSLAEAMDLEVDSPDKSITQGRLTFLASRVDSLISVEMLGEGLPSSSLVTMGGEHEVDVEFHTLMSMGHLSLGVDTPRYGRGTKAEEIRRTFTVLSALNLITGEMDLTKTMGPPVLVAFAGDTLQERPALEVLTQVREQAALGMAGINERAMRERPDIGKAIFGAINTVYRGLDDSLQLEVKAALATVAGLDDKGENWSEIAALAPTGVAEVDAQIDDHMFRLLETHSRAPAFQQFAQALSIVAQRAQGDLRSHLADAPEGSLERRIHKVLKMYPDIEASLFTPYGARAIEIDEQRRRPNFKVFKESMLATEQAFRRAADTAKSRISALPDTLGKQFVAGMSRNESVGADLNIRLVLPALRTQDTPEGIRVMPTAGEWTEGLLMGREMIEVLPLTYTGTAEHPALTHQVEIASILSRRQKELAAIEQAALWGEWSPPMSPEALADLDHLRELLAETQADATELISTSLAARAAGAKLPGAGVTGFPASDLTLGPRQVYVGEAADSFTKDIYNEQRSKFIKLTLAAPPDVQARMLEVSELFAAPTELFLPERYRAVVRELKNLAEALRANKDDHEIYKSYCKVLYSTAWAETTSAYEEDPQPGEPPLISQPQAEVQSKLVELKPRPERPPLTPAKAADIKFSLKRSPPGGASKLKSRLKRPAEDSKPQVPRARPAIKRDESKTSKVKPKPAAIAPPETRPALDPTGSVSPEASQGRPPLQPFTKSPAPERAKPAKSPQSPRRVKPNDEKPSRQKRKLIRFFLINTRAPEYISTKPPLETTMSRALRKANLVDSATPPATAAPKKPLPIPESFESLVYRVLPKPILEVLGGLEGIKYQDPPPDPDGFLVRRAGAPFMMSAGTSPPLYRQAEPWGKANPSQIAPPKKRMATTTLLPMVSSWWMDQGDVDGDAYQFLRTSVAEMREQFLREAAEAIELPKEERESRLDHLDQLGKRIEREVEKLEALKPKQTPEMEFWKQKLDEIDPESVFYKEEEARQRRAGYSSLSITRARQSAAERARFGEMLEFTVGWLGLPAEAAKLMSPAEAQGMTTLFRAPLADLDGTSQRTQAALARGEKAQRILMFIRDNPEARSLWTGQVESILGVVPQIEAAVPEAKGQVPELLAEVLRHDNLDVNVRDINALVSSYKALSAAGRAAAAEGAVETFQKLMTKGMGTYINEEQLLGIGGAIGTAGGSLLGPIFNIITPMAMDVFGELVYAQALENPDFVEHFQEELTKGPLTEARRKLLLELEDPEQVAADARRRFTVVRDVSASLQTLMRESIKSRGDRGLAAEVLTPFEIDGVSGTLEEHLNRPEADRGEVLNRFISRIMGPSLGNEYGITGLGALHLLHKYTSASDADLYKLQEYAQSLGAPVREEGIAATLAEALNRTVASFRASRFGDHTEAALQVLQDLPGTPELAAVRQRIAERGLTGAEALTEYLLNEVQRAGVFTAQSIEGIRQVAQYRRTAKVNLEEAETKAAEVEKVMSSTTTVLLSLMQRADQLDPASLMSSSFGLFSAFEASRERLGDALWISGYRPKEERAVMQKTLNQAMSHSYLREASLAYASMYSLVAEVGALRRLASNSEENRQLIHDRIAELEDRIQTIRQGEFDYRQEYDPKIAAYAKRTLEDIRKLTTPKAQETRKQVEKAMEMLGRGETPDSLDVNRMVGQNNNLIDVLVGPTLIALASGGIGLDERGLLLGVDILQSIVMTPGFQAWQPQQVAENLRGAASRLGMPSQAAEALIPDWVGQPMADPRHLSNRLRMGRVRSIVANAETTLGGVARAMLQESLISSVGAVVHTGVSKIGGPGSATSAVAEVASTLAVLSVARSFAAEVTSGSQVPDFVERLLREFATQVWMAVEQIQLFLNSAEGLLYDEETETSIDFDMEAFPGNIAEGLEAGLIVVDPEDNIVPSEGDPFLLGLYETVSSLNSGGIRAFFSDNNPQTSNR